MCTVGSNGWLNSGVSDAAQSGADNAEYQNILSSIDRIVGQARFAGQTLLDGNFSATNAARFQAGEQATHNVTLSIQGVGVSNLSMGGTTVSTVRGASATLSRVSAAINTVTNLRGTRGAFQANTLETGLRS